MSSFALRVPDYIMDEARSAAEDDGTSVNQLLASLIAHGLGQRRAMRTFRERAARGDVAAALAVLDKAPDVPPVEGDELPEQPSAVAPGF